MPEFIQGLVLSETFYWKAVRPILDQHFPDLRYAAGLIGDDSDVLGYDTPVSCDHEWGPRLLIFLTPDDFDSSRQAIHETLRQELPVQFLGYSTHFSRPDPNDNGVRHRVDIEQGPVDHHIDFLTISSFIQGQLGVNPFNEPDPVDWLTFPEQSLLQVTAGKVFYDRLGLEEIRQKFAYYPRDVWLYLMASEWDLISQIEAFIGRTWSVGDELGSRLLTGRMARLLMHLCFLMEKRYAPYSKWFGTGFKQLACYDRMGPLLENAVAAGSYFEREHYLARAYILAAEMHNCLGITPPLETRTRTYSGWFEFEYDQTEMAIDDPGNTRPYQCISGGRFAEAIRSAIQSPEIKAISPMKGSVEQFLVESSQALGDHPFLRRLKKALIQDQPGT